MILTSLSDFSPAYSVATVAIEQARLLAEHGHEVRLLVNRVFNPRDLQEATREGIPVEASLPAIKLYDYQPQEGPRADFEDNVRLLREAYSAELSGADVVITHDLMFLGWHLPNNQALREVASACPYLRWLHWCHSGPSARPNNLCFPSTLRYEGMDRSYYVTVAGCHRNDFANMLGLPISRVVTIYNPHLPAILRDFSLAEREFISRIAPWDVDIFQAFPFSLPRWSPKGVPQLLTIFSGFKRLGLSVRLCLVTAHSSQESDLKHIVQIRDWTERHTCLEWRRDVITTTEVVRDTMEGQTRNEWLYCVPHKVVRILVRLSDVFIFPSIAEACSLVQAEASLAGAFLVINRQCNAQKEFSTPHVLGFDFTGNDPAKNPTYYECAARETWSWIAAWPTYWQRKAALRTWYNPDWIYRNQLEPTLIRLVHEFA